jgi:hypothetical protein
MDRPPMRSALLAMYYNEVVVEWVIDLLLAVCPLVLYAVLRKRRFAKAMRLRSKLLPPDKKA